MKVGVIGMGLRLKGLAAYMRCGLSLGFSRNTLCHCDSSPERDTTDRPPQGCLAYYRSCRRSCGVLSALLSHCKYGRPALDFLEQVVGSISGYVHPSTTGAYLPYGPMSSPYVSSLYLSNPYVCLYKPWNSTD